MSFTDLLVHSADIQRFTISGSDAHGNPTKTWANIYTAQACRMGRMNGRQLVNGGQLVQIDLIMNVPDIDITEEDRVIWEGQTFKVLLVDHVNDATTTNHHKEVSLQVLKGSGNPT
jgi:head-tail adaptor